MADQAAESTPFTLDNMGRYLCNTWKEVSASMNETVGGRSRGLDVIVIGGGTFGSVIAHELFGADRRLVDERLHLRTVPRSGDPAWQLYTAPPALVPGKWHELEIDIRANRYVVRMRNMDDGTPFVQTTDSTNLDGDRALANGFIGLQSYPNAPVAFRHIRLKP